MCPEITWSELQRACTESNLTSSWQRYKSWLLHFIHLICIRDGDRSKIIVITDKIKTTFESTRELRIISTKRFRKRNKTSGNLHLKNPNKIQIENKTLRPPLFKRSEETDTNQNERDLLLPNDNQYFTQGKNKSCIAYTFVATRNTELSTLYSFHLNEDETILIRVPTNKLTGDRSLTAAYYFTYCMDILLPYSMSCHRKTEQ